MKKIIDYLKYIYNICCVYVVTVSGIYIYAKILEIIDERNMSQFVRLVFTITFMIVILGFVLKSLSINWNDILKIKDKLQSKTYKGNETK